MTPERGKLNQVKKNSKYGKSNNSSGQLYYLREDSWLAVDQLTWKKTLVTLFRHVKHSIFHVKESIYVAFEENTLLWKETLGRRYFAREFFRLRRSSKRIQVSGQNVAETSFERIFPLDRTVESVLSQIVVARKRKTTAIFCYTYLLVWDILFFRCSNLLAY